MNDVYLKLFLRDYLKNRGYIVYPSEIFVRGRLLDVAAFKKGYFYAFECKSYNDRVKLSQLENYANAFDYVILVSERMHPRLEREFKKRGYGLWLLESEEEGIVEIIKPSVQCSSSFYKIQIEQKFKRATGYPKLFIPSIPNFYMATLEDYLGE